MKRFDGFLLVMLFLIQSASALADNAIELGDVDSSELQIEQGNSSATSSNNTIKTGDLEKSPLNIKQGNQNPLKEAPSSSLWKELRKTIMTGAVGLCFALLLWFIKRKMGDRSED